MNKHLKNLADVANVSLNDSNTVAFAISIILECSRIVDARDSSHPYASFGDLIKGYFEIDRYD
jgi:hypothetical protein